MSLTTAASRERVERVCKPHFTKCAWLVQRAEQPTRAIPAPKSTGGTNKGRHSCKGGIGTSLPEWEGADCRAFWATSFWLPTAPAATVTAWCVIVDRAKLTHRCPMPCTQMPSHHIRSSSTASSNQQHKEINHATLASGSLKAVKLERVTANISGSTTTASCGLVAAATSICC